MNATHFETQGRRALRGPTKSLASIILGAILIMAPRASRAQDSPQDVSVLLREAHKFTDSGDLNAALTVLREARKASPVGSNLLAIADGLVRSGRIAEAMEVYKEYLGDPNNSSRRRKKTQATLLKLLQRVGSVELLVTPENSSVRVDGRTFPITTDPNTILTLDLGPNKVEIFHDGFETRIIDVDSVAGHKTFVETSLSENSAEAQDEETKPLPAVPAPSANNSNSSAATTAQSSPTQRPERERLPWEIPLRKGGLGALLGAHIDLESRGGAALVGISYGARTWLDIIAGGVLGKRKAGYLGARIFILEEEVTPVVSAGAIAFVSNPSDIALRAGGGLAWSPYDKLWFVAELAVELYPSASETYKRSLYVPSIAVEGRL